MYKRCKFKVFSLEFSDSIFGQNNFLCSDWMVASAKKPEHGKKLDASGLYASGRTQSEINIYSSKLIIVKMTFQLGRFDSFYKKLWKLKPWKGHVFKENKNKNKMLSIWSKFCLNQEATTHSYAWEINYHMSKLSNIKDTKKYLKRHTTNYRRVLQSILSCEEPERNRKNKRHDAW